MNTKGLVSTQFSMGNTGITYILGQFGKTASCRGRVLVVPQVDDDRIVRAIERRTAREQHHAAELDEERAVAVQVDRALEGELVTVRVMVRGASDGCCRG
jgi:regulator of protease activity HflC (stomatin/prohibitin superfamily)